jgi:5-formyltetrahydrofolate cyclo-ligase
VDKTELRAQRLAARSRMLPDERVAAGRALRDAVLEMPQVEMGGTIAAYYSIGTEPGTHSLLYALWKRGTYVLLPILLPDGDLDWASFEGPDSLVPGPHGLREPGEPPRGPEAVSRADVVLVPALAVDQSGNRLGRGGGSYDRALARVAPLIPTIALLYDEDLLPAIPTAPHDRPVTHTARPSHGVHSIGQLRD